MITRSLLIRRSVVEEDDIFVTLPTGSGKSLINQKNGADRHTRLLRFVAFVHLPFSFPGTDLGGVCRGCAPLPEMICGFLIQLMFTSGHHWVMPFLSGAPPPKKNSGSAPGASWYIALNVKTKILNSIRWVTGNQCKENKTGVIWLKPRR